MATKYDTDDLENAASYYDQLAQTPVSVKDPDDRSYDQLVQDFASVHDPSQSLASQASDFAAKSSVASPVRRREPLRDEVVHHDTGAPYEDRWYDDANQYETTPYHKQNEVVGPRRSDTENSSGGNRTGVSPLFKSEDRFPIAQNDADFGAYRGKNYDVVAKDSAARDDDPTARAGTSPEWAEEGAQYTKDREADEHDMENARRIQKGLPTIEEEARNKARAKAAPRDTGGGRTAENDDGEHPMAPVLSAAKTLYDGGHDEKAKTLLASAINESDVANAQPAPMYVNPMNLGGVSQLPMQTKQDPYAGFKRVEAGSQGDPNALLNAQKAERSAVSPEDEQANRDYIQQQNNPPPADLNAQDAYRPAPPPTDKPETPFVPQGPVNPNPINPVTGQPIPPPPQPQPLQVPQQRTVPGGWQFAGSPETRGAMNEYRRLRDMGLTDNEIDARMANQQIGQFHAQRTGELQAEQEAMRQRQLEAVQAKQRAQNVYDAAQKEASSAKVDPDKAFGGGVGKMFAMLGAALGAFGATLTHTPNQAAEMMRDQINASLEAQKAEIKGKEKTADSAYARLLAATGDEKQADAAFRQMGYQVADSQAQEMGAHVRDAQLVGELRQGLANAAKEDFGQDMNVMRYSPGGQVGGVPKDIMDKAMSYAEKMAGEAKDPSQFTPARDQYLRNRGYATGGMPEGPAFATNAGGGRSAGVQMEHRRMLGRYDTTLTNLDDAIAKVKSGYDPFAETEAKKMKIDLAQEYAFLMHGGSSEGSVEKQAETIPDLNSLLSSKDSQLRALQYMKKNMEAKKLQEQQAGESIPQGQGFGGQTPMRDIEADTGAKED